MNKIIYVLLLIPFLVFGSNKYYAPTPMENSAGTPLPKTTTIIAYPTGTTSNGITLTWGGGATWYTTTEPNNAAYDFYANGILYKSQVWWPTSENIIADGSVDTDAISDSSVTSAKIANYLIDYVTPEQYGAVGDGTTDDRAAFLSAFSSKKPVVLRGGITYYIDGTLSFKDTSLTLICNSSKKATLKFNGNVTGLNLGNLSASAIDTATLADTVIVGERRATVDDASNFNNGDLVRILSTHYWDSSTTAEQCLKGELLSVFKVDADTIWFNQPFNDTYDPAVETVTFANYTPVSVYIEGVRLLSEDKSSANGIYLFNSIGSVIINCEIDSFLIGINLTTSLNTLIKDNILKSGTTSYGVVTVGSSDTRILHNYINGFRRGVDISMSFGLMPSRYNYVFDNDIIGFDGAASYGVGSHSGAEFTIYENNRIRGISFNAIQIRGKSETARGNTLYGVGNLKGDIAEVVLITSGSEDVTIENNTFISGTNHKQDILSGINSILYDIPQKLIVIDSLTIGGTGSYYNIIGNKMLWAKSTYPLIEIGKSLSNLIIKDNIIGLNDKATGNIKFLSSYYGDTVTVNNAKIYNNTFIRKNGTFTFIRDKQVLFDVNSEVRYELDNIKYEYSVTDSLMIPERKLVNVGIPADPIAGSTYYKSGKQTQTDTLFVYTGSIWSPFLSDSIGVTNYAAVFDSATVLSLATDVTFDSTDTWTFELWIKENYTNPQINNYIFDYTGASYSTLVYTNINNIVYIDSSYGYGLSSNYLLSAGNNAIAGQWVHVAVSHDGNGLAKIIVYNNYNGVEYTEYQSSSPWFHFYLDQIGASSVGTIGYWKGWIDEFRVWSDVRTLSEIRSNRKKELVGNEAGLLYYWKFDKTLTSDATANNLTEDEGTVTYDSLEVPFHE